MCWGLWHEVLVVEESPLVFLLQISLLAEIRKYHGNPSYVLDFRTDHVDKDLSYEEEPVAIIDRQVRQSRSQSFPLSSSISRLRDIEALVDSIGKPLILFS